MKNRIRLNRNNLANILIQFTDKNGNLVFNNNDTISIDLADTGSTLFQNYIVCEKDTYQTISYYFYGTVQLWWLIAKMNNVTDATSLPKLGTTIRILSPEFLNTVLNSVAIAEQ